MAKKNDNEMTWREAAVAALEGAGPLRVDQITERIDELGLRELTGSTPEATVGVQLYLAVQNHDPRVRHVGPGLFEHTGDDVEATSDVPLGRLEFINPRRVWTDEARHFTPWLLQNKDYLEQVLGLDIELEQSEHPIGSFSLDLYGRDVTHGCPLIIENQLETTDHRHLGQLLTYAAGADGYTIVWVAPEFRDEHRAALDFLNKISVGEARFFGVKLRVAVIGDSGPAPDFELVAQPSGWRSRVRAQRGGDSGVSSLQAAYLDFWTRYLERVHAEHPGITNVRSAQPANWLNMSFQRRLAVTGTFSAANGLRCELYIDVGDRDANRRLFDALRERQEPIERQIGETLDWDPLEGRQACRISVSTPGRVTDDDTDAQIDWLLDRHVKFRDTFFPIIAKFPSELWLGPDE